MKVNLNEMADSAADAARTTFKSCPDLKFLDVVTRVLAKSVASAVFSEIQSEFSGTLEMNAANKAAAIVLVGKVKQRLLKEKSR